MYEKRKTHCFWTIGSNEITVPDGEPLRRSIRKPTQRRHARLIRPSAGITAGKSDKSGFSLESSPWSEGECEGGDFEEFTESVGFWSEDLDISASRH